MCLILFSYGNVKFCARKPPSSIFHKDIKHMEALEPKTTLLVVLKALPWLCVSTSAAQSRDLGFKFLRQF
jgi:hypothetical protein